MVMWTMLVERRCQHGALRCDSGRCIPPQLVCNGHVDCGLHDTTEERYCAGKCYLSPACRACDYVYIDYVRRSRSSSCHLLRPINCQTYITLHYITLHLQ